MEMRALVVPKPLDRVRTVTVLRHACIRAPASQGRPAEVCLCRGKQTMVTFLGASKSEVHGETNERTGLTKTLIPSHDTHANGGSRRLLRIGYPTLSSMDLRMQCIEIV